MVKLLLGMIHRELSRGVHVAAQIQQSPRIFFHTAFKSYENVIILPTRLSHKGTGHLRREIMRSQGGEGASDAPNVGWTFMPSLECDLLIVFQRRACSKSGVQFQGVVRRSVQQVHAVTEIVCVPSRPFRKEVDFSPPFGAISDAAAGAAHRRKARSSFLSTSPN